MAKVNMTICDKCQDYSRPAQAWAIHAPLDTYKLDLCDEHSAELLDTIKAFVPDAKPITPTRPSTTRRSTTRRTGKDFVTRVATIEEIEASKKKPKAKANADS